MSLCQVVEEIREEDLRERVRLSSELDDARRELREAHKERDAATAQVREILRAKAETERVCRSMEHEVANLISVLTSHRRALEAAGIPLGPPNPVLRTEAVVILNSAVAAAQGRSYQPYAQEVELRKLNRTLRERITAGLRILTEFEAEIDVLPEFESCYSHVFGAITRVRKAVDPGGRP